MPSLRSWSIRGCLALALLGLAACGGGSGGDDGPSDQAKDACERLNDVLAEVMQAEGALTQEQAQRLLRELRSIADEADEAASEDSAYFVISNGVDQIISGLESINATQVNANTRTVARACIEQFPQLTTTTTAATSTTAGTEGTEP